MKKIDGYIPLEKLDIVCNSIEAAHGLPNECYLGGDYSKFERKDIPSKNFHNEKWNSNEREQSRKIDKLWDDLTDEERSEIIHDSKIYGDFYPDLQSDQEKSFYEWKQKNDGFVNETVHDNLYSEYPDKSSATKSFEWTDEDYLKVGKRELNDEFIEESSDKKIIEQVKNYERYGIMDRLERELINKHEPKQYFQLAPNDRNEIAGNFFNTLKDYEQSNILSHALDIDEDQVSSYAEEETEDGEPIIKFDLFTSSEQNKIVREIEGDINDEDTRYDVESYFAQLQPKKAVGFDYERGIPEPQSVELTREWSNRMNPFQYWDGREEWSTKTSIPTYPKAEQRSVEEHEEQIKKLNSNLKKETIKTLEEKYQSQWNTLTLYQEKSDFIDYVQKQEPNLTLNLELYKKDKIRSEYEMYGTSEDSPKTEKEWRKQFLSEALFVGGSKVAKKVNQLKYFNSLLNMNPELKEKYQPILDKTEKLNHENFDLFLKTPEFYRGTSTDELDHYIENNNLGKLGDWGTKSYDFTSLSLDKNSAQSPSEHGSYLDGTPKVSWKKGSDGVFGGGKVMITFEGDSVRDQSLPVQYNVQGSINWQGADASEFIGMPYNMEAYKEREVRMNPDDSIPKIKEINFGVNYGKVKDKKIISKSQRKKLVDKYKSLVGGDVSKIKFYKFVEAGESYIAQEFKEEDHPRDEDGKFTDKDGSNSRVERQRSILQQEIDYLKKSIKEESKKYRPFEKVSDEDLSIRYKNKSVLEKIKELEEELNSGDTVGLPHIPLKPNTHEIETIENGMYLSNSDSDPEYESEREVMKTWSDMKLGLHPLEGFKKGNSTIKVSIDMKEKGSYGISRETAEKQINLTRIMWNSLSDEERDSIHNLTIEQRPSIKMVKNEKGEDVIDSESMHEASVVGSWAFNTNELTIRIDSDLKPEQIKGTFIHEVGHSMYHKIKDKHPERIKKWKEMVKKIPPTTKYGKYNLKRWKDGEKQFKELEANNWEWYEVVAKDSDGNVIRTEPTKRFLNGEIKMEKKYIAKEEVEKLKSNALSNITFYKDLYFNEIHSEVHMYMMGQQKRGHMKKTGRATKGISKFVEPYRLLHDLPKMEEPLIVGEAEEDSPIMEMQDITESIGEVIIYLDENFERVLNEDEGEYEFIIELNDDMTIKKYSIKFMWEEIATEEFVEDDHPRDDDGKFTDKGGGVGSSTKTKTRKRKRRSKSKTKTSKKPVKRNKLKMRSRKSKDSGQRKHSIKTYPNTKVVITGITTQTNTDWAIVGDKYTELKKQFTPELVTVFEEFWNNDSSVKAMRKHIDYIGLIYQKNPKRGGYWNTEDKKIVIHDYPYQTLSHFKNTVVHEIVGHTFWDLARTYFRNDLIEFNELANKMPPVNSYCKKNEEKWKTWNDETDNQIKELNKKYGLKENRYGYIDVGEQLWGDDADKYGEAMEKIKDGKFIGNPSNQFINRDSSSMTRYANEQHSAITEIMYKVQDGSFEEGAEELLIDEENLEKLKKAWLKLHPKYPQKTGESWNNPFENYGIIVSTEDFKEEEHPRDEDGKFADKDGGNSGKTYESGEKVNEYRETIKEDITPSDEENEKNLRIEKSVIDGITERIKGTNYDNKIKFIETQGSFAKGTDLAGSSDLDIFVVFDYDLDIDEIEEVVLELGEDVLKPISDEGEYKIMNGANKKYPESYVDGVEVQIIGTSDVTLEQIAKGFEDGGMKTATDRSPHHTKFMQEALKGKEQEVRTLKKFFKNAGVYDASIAKQGFSGFSTEVLIHNLGSFDKVLEFFANFEKGSVVGETDRKFDTPLVMIDPIDKNRNLASAFSHSDKEGSIIPNKNLARLVKSAQSVIETGKLPDITTKKEDSLSMEFTIPPNMERNEVYSQAYSSALNLRKIFERNGYGVKVPKENVTDEFDVEVPRINVEYDGDRNVKINFALKNFENEYEYKSKMKKDRPKEEIDAFMERNDDVVEKDGVYYARVKKEYDTAEKFLNALVDGKIKSTNIGKVGMLKDGQWVSEWNTDNISRGETEYENITGDIKSNESYVLVTEAEFKEEEHPRDDDGKFAKKGSGSSSQKTKSQKLDDGIRPTKEFIKKWGGGFSRTVLYDNLIDKGGLSSATWKTADNHRVGDRLSTGIKSKNGHKDWNNAKKMFMQKVKDNLKFKKVYKEYEREVNENNKHLKKTYNESKTFYRGGAVDELKAIFGKYGDNYNSEWRSKYDFKSLSMNYNDTLRMYNGGMMIHFNGDSVREVSKLVNYSAEPTEYLHASVDSSINQREIENIDTDNPSFLMDEEEVRVRNDNMNDVKIEKIEIFMGSAGFGVASDFLHKEFGIEDYSDKHYELRRLTVDSYYSDKNDSDNKYFDVIDGKIVDKKTNKVYEKTYETLKEVDGYIKLDIQNALMKNKKFREKVKEVVIK